MQIKQFTKSLFFLAVTFGLGACAANPPSNSATTPEPAVKAEVKQQKQSILQALNLDSLLGTGSNNAKPEESKAGSSGDWRQEIVLRSLSLLGVNYKFGGNSVETGLDCSGLVRLVVHDVIGKVLPRRSEEISRIGQPVEADELKPGDLVFFNTLRKTFSHVGIYIGNNQFVHAPSSGGFVRIEKLDKQYWNERFNGARRLLGAAPGQASPTPVQTATPLSPTP